MSQKADLKTVDEAENEVELAEVPETPGFDNPELKDLGVVDDDHHAVQEIGTAAMEKSAGSGAGKFIAEEIYGSDKAWVREWLQNEEAACIRTAKMFIRQSDEYDDGWLTLTKYIDDETGETVVDHDESNALLSDFDDDVDPADLRQMSVPRPIDDVIEAARSLGYDPTIVWDVFLDERKIITVDNGDGMTPTEFDKYFNSPFESLSGEDAESGGMYGVGSESSAILHGDEGGMECEIRSRKPDEDGETRKGFRAYSYLGGGNIIPGEVEDGFFGCRFKIPVQKSFNLNKVQGWVETYADKLRVPILYREHDSGHTPVEEEYEATHFVDDYNDPPIVIEKPGEYTIVSGPETTTRGYRSNYNEDTFLISMPIDRNQSSSINSLWDVIIQLHDEQNKIVMGPNRGRYENNVEVQEDDVVMPGPTGDRDRLNQGSQQNQFFDHIEEVVKAEELSQISDIAHRMKDADHPADALTEDSDDWKLFKKTLNYHSGYKDLSRISRFKNFIGNLGGFPNFTDTEAEQIYGLFQETEYCSRGPGNSNRKSRRSDEPLGSIIAGQDRSHVFMAASTGGNFTDRFRVVKNTFDDAKVIVISGTNKYEKWGNAFGFNILKEVPVKKSDDDADDPHDFDVPESVHQRHKKKGRSSMGKSDKVLDRDLKIRTDAENSSVDLRHDISTVKESLAGHQTIGGHQRLILFPNGQDHENISDHYDMAKYAAIASVSKTEYDELKDCDRVMTYEEYTDWSESALIATEDGAMTPSEIIDDDRMAIIAYNLSQLDDVVSLLADENEELRNKYCDDIRDQYDWPKALDNYDGGYGGDSVDDVDDSDKNETLFAVADSIVLNRANWAFDSLNHTRRDVVGMKFSRKKYGHRNPFKWFSLNGSEQKYRLMIDTPNWDDSSDVYEVFPKHRDCWKGQVLLGLHDRGIDPTKEDNDNLRSMI
jgi:hypothetical protein